MLSFSLADDVWAAWQFDRPDLGEGMVLALRRPASPFTVMTPRLHGLDPQAEYELRDLDSGQVRRLAGQTLCESGVTIEIGQAPGSQLLVYRRAGVAR